MTIEEIKEINNKCPSSEQGIYTEPYGIPVHIKEPVIYCRYETGGWRGGSCWSSENLHSYEEPEPEDKMKVLELVLEILYPKVTYLQFRKIEKLIHDNFETEHEYYGNSTDYKIEYIILSELEELIKTFD